ncbi:blue light sensor protein [Mariprofundus sp. EBB-1]|uniref:BLUF domain-containing protein n=1 Tax=Mariprofundus sp. EBB-1 TaxID=2650971 RepID=UPI000EF1E389|nr:BLUF domain-containing protein [Mariprofundus sp. EBB-1]RLL55588.1 blue light sensor protein [Mariprofundus sp. EBB-1]
MIRIVYVSVATKPFDDKELLQLLARCRASNTERLISGQLIYSDGTFMQVLEGPEKEVDATYARIKKDTRHTNVTLLERNTIDEKQFPDWSMGFKTLNREQLEGIQGYNYQFDEDVNGDNPFTSQLFVSELMKNVKNQYVADISREGAALHQADTSLIGYLNKLVNYTVLVLAALMAFVVLCGVAEIAAELYVMIKSTPYVLLSISGITSTFASFLAVLIAIDIFINISLYVRKHVIAVRLVVATALMAVARKIIVLEFADIQPMQIIAMAGLVAVLGFCYYYLSRLKEND